MFRQLAKALFPESFAKSHDILREGGDRRPPFFLPVEAQAAQGRDAFAPKPSFELSSDLTPGLFAEDARILANLPLFHSFGFTITTLYPLLEGLGLYFTPSPDLVSSLRRFVRTGRH